MSNVVTYAIELLPENATKIDQINRILLGTDYTADVMKADKAVSSKPTKTSEAVKESTAPAKEELPVVSAEKFKKAAQQAKKEHGEDFCIQVLKDIDVEAATLGRAIVKVEEDQRQSVMDIWSAGPTEQASDEPDDLDEEDEDDFDDEEDDSEVSVEAVKTALKAYAKKVGRDEARELMQSAGAKSLSAVDNLSSAKLSALFKKLV